MAQLTEISNQHDLFHWIEISLNELICKIAETKHNPDLIVLEDKCEFHLNEFLIRVHMLSKTLGLRTEDSYNFVRFFIKNSENGVILVR